MAPGRGDTFGSVPSVSLFDRRLREGSPAPMRRDTFCHWRVILDDMRRGLFSGKNGSLWVSMPCFYLLLIAIVGNRPSMS